MEPPILESVKRRYDQFGMPHVKKIKFDLFNDLPENIGSRFEEPHKQLFFKEQDSKLILDYIEKLLSGASEPEENVIHDLHVVGLMPTEVGSIMSANLRLWDNVKDLSYAAPRKSESLIFETKIFPKEF